MLAAIPQYNPATFTVTFTDKAGAVFDPVQNIVIVVEQPDQSVQTYAYPAQLAKLSMGVYAITLPLNESGYYEAYGQGELANNDLVTTPTVTQPVTPATVVP